MFDKNFWEKKYTNDDAQWNAGAITTPIKDYIDQLTNKKLTVLVPGIGHGHELMYLHKCGFTNILGLDFTIVAALEAYGLMNDFPYGDVILGDFFEHEGQYDLIIEQTFFCSLSNELRVDYVNKMYDLLKPGGKLVGVLFDCQFNQDVPPFGGSKSEYLDLFKEKFEIKILETAYNSIKPRAGRELFFIIHKQHD